MSQPRNWLCLITSDREYENVDALTRDIWTHFDGICAVVHNQSANGEVAALLDARKGEGFVVERDFLWHHGHSMNEWLLNQHIGLMDACWVRDSSERFSPAFTRGISAFSADLLKHDIWNLAQRSKLLMFRRWYGQQFFNGLHWGLHGLQGATISIDRMAQFADDRTYAYSVRDEQRPKTHRYRHELLYLLDYGANGNHLALFHPDPADLERAQWGLFHYTTWLRERGVTTADQLIAYWKEHPLCDRQTGWINAERPLRNAYRFFVLGHVDQDIVKDEDTWRLI
jgi:hypothetical protein